MKQQYLWAKIAIVAALSAASSAAWAENCYFTGGHYSDARDTNTLYLESFTTEGSEVVFDNAAANCVKNNASRGMEIMVIRDTPLKTNSTLVLPVDGTVTDECIDVYYINNFSEVDGRWEITAKNDVHGQIQKNRMFLLVTHTEDAECGDIRVIRLQATNIDNISGVEANQDLHDDIQNPSNYQTGLTIVGTYKYKKWESDDKEIDRIWGYAAKDKGAVAGGQFVKIGGGAYVPPLRAYLRYRDFEHGLYKASSDKASSDKKVELPETIEVRLIDSDSTLSIGKLNPVTGEIQMDSRRFDLNGRAINAKPANHGVYVGKQKMVR